MRSNEGRQLDVQFVSNLEAAIDQRLAARDRSKTWFRLSFSAACKVVP
jgi:hypothetical protein